MDAFQCSVRLCPPSTGFGECSLTRFFTGTGTTFLHSFVPRCLRMRLRRCSESKPPCHTSLFFYAAIVSIYTLPHPSMPLLPSPSDAGNATIVLIEFKSSLCKSGKVHSAFTSVAHLLWSCASDTNGMTLTVERYGWLRLRGWEKEKLGCSVLLEHYYALFIRFYALQAK